MNFEKILAENMIRYGVKNVDILEFSRKFLTEQSQADLIQKIKDNNDAYKQYLNWQTDNSGRIKVVKTFGYRTIEPRIKDVTVPFFNNFVTIDQGSPKPADMKAAIDNVLDELKQAGANLDSPETIIDIISTATDAPAGVNIDNAAKAAGRKQLDHDYGLSSSGDIKTALAVKQKSDQQWGNKILAQKRGESAKAYIESKGIKAKIIITTKIVPIKQGRYFQIVAKIQGSEKYILPVKVPPFQITLNLTIEKSSMSQTRLGQYGDTPNQMYTFEPVLKVDSSVTTNFGIFGSNTNFAGSNTATSLAGILPSTGTTYTGEAWKNRIDPEQGGIFTNPFSIHSIGHLGGNKTAEEFSGMTPQLILGGIGRFTPAAANAIIRVQLRVPTSPLWIAMHGQNFASAITNWQTQCKGIRPFKQGDANHKKYDAVSFPKIQISKTFNIADLARAAKAIGLDASEQISMDVKYWTEAAYFDATKTPPPANYGLIKTNPTFFNDVLSIVEE